MTGVALEPQLLQARARSGVIDFGPRAGSRAHLVLTDPHSGPAEKALCGARPVYGWVMLPVALEDCPRCQRADERASSSGGGDQRPVQPPSPAASP